MDYNITSRMYPLRGIENLLNENGIESFRKSFFKNSTWYDGRTTLIRIEKENERIFLRDVIPPFYIEGELISEVEIREYYLNFSDHFIRDVKSKIRLIEDIVSVHIFSLETFEGVKKYLIPILDELIGLADNWKKSNSSKLFPETESLLSELISKLTSYFDKYVSYDELIKDKHRTNNSAISSGDLRRDENLEIEHVNFRFKGQSEILQQLYIMKVGPTPVFNHEIISLDRFIEILSSPNKLPIEDVIQFNIETQQAAYILLEKLQPIFDNLSPLDIEKSSCFKTKKGKVFTLKYLKQSLKLYIESSQTPKNIEDIDLAFNNLLS
jgi:hypothetical protein